MGRSQKGLDNLTLSREGTDLVVFWVAPLSHLPACPIPFTVMNFTMYNFRAKRTISGKTNGHEPRARVKLFHFQIKASPNVLSSQN